LGDGGLGVGEIGLLLVAGVVGFFWYSLQGQVNAEAVARGQQRGFRAAWLVLFGSLLGDEVWIAAGLAILALAGQIDAVRVVLSVVGSFLMLRFAWSALQDARTGALPVSKLPDRGGDLATGAFVSFRNPYALGLWLGVSAALLYFATPAPGLVAFALCWLGLVGGAYLWALLLAWLAARPGDPPSPAFFRAVNGVAGVALAFAGVAVLWNTLRAAG